MCSDHLVKTEKIFRKAIQIVDAGEREAYVREACAGDTQLQQEIESLLAADDRAGEFLEVPPADCNVTLDASPLAEGPGTIIGPYKLLEKIGEGGMAVVYMAKQETPLIRRVALKIIKLGMDTQEVIARFEIERQALALMDHPNIAKVLDAGVTETGRPYFVMELVRGISITEYCDKNRLNTAERLALFVPVCNAVHHAHQKGIIHRDIKPSNIMVTMHDSCPVPMVIDFGIAKATNQRLTEKTVFTRYAQMIGTPEYMSPEQAEMSGLDIDIRTDIYSLGAVLYELLTGALPFDPDTLRSAGFGEIQRIIREEEPLRPSTRISTLGQEAEEIAVRRCTNVGALTKCLYKELEWIPLKAMRKDRTRRYTSASEFATDIHNYLSDRPLLAGPESVLYRLRKAMHKHRVSVIAVSAVAAALIIGLIISTSLYVRMHRALHTVSYLENQAEVDNQLLTVQRLYAEGRYQAALKEIEVTLEVQDLGLKAHLLRARLLLEVGQPKNAEERLLELTRAGPEIAGTAHYLLARVNVGVDAVKAREHEARAKSILPETAEAYSLRAMTASSPDRALQWLGQALTLDPTHYPSRKARALLYCGLEVYDKMTEDVGALIALRPADALGYALRAILRRESGLFADAVADHNRAIELCAIRTELPELYNQRRETYMSMGNHDGALKDARHCVSLDPDEVSHHRDVSTTLLELGNFAGARQEYKKGRQRWHRGFGTGDFIFAALGTGKTFEFPSNLVQKAPFAKMQREISCYRDLTRRAIRVSASRQGLRPRSWSPDGKKMVCHWFGSAGDLLTMVGDPLPTFPNKESCIMVFDIKLGKQRLLTTFGVDPVWSPDGKYIAFSDYERAGQIRSLWIIPAEGGEPRKLTKGVWPVWSKDSQRLFFRRHWRSQGESSESDICSISIHDPNPLPETFLSGAGTSRFVLSKDETWLAFETSKGLQVLDTSSGLVLAKWASPWPLYGWALHLAPNEKELCIGACSWTGNIGTFIYNIEQNCARQVFDNPVGQALWSPDGSKLAINAAGEIWIADIDPNVPTHEALGQAMSLEDVVNRWIAQRTQTIAVDPLDPEIYLERAIAYLSRKDYEKAEADLDVFDTLITREHCTWWCLGCELYWWAWQHYHVGRYKEAELLGLHAVKMRFRFPDIGWMEGLSEVLLYTYDAWNKPKLAQEWRTRLSDFKAKNE